MPMAKGTPTLRSGALHVKQFACGDVVPGCDATFAASEDAAILDLVAAHARADHGLTEIGPELVDQILVSIRAA